ncbi:MAG: flagellar motor protein MotB, partial [Pseudomonadota bacterium]
MNDTVLEELEQEPRAEQKAGVPAWVMTFADLMTLLMCFFVLLLAFSEMDVLRFKQLSGSVREAFGVQTEIEAKTIPKGTSIIAQEFSPGIPQPTPLNVVRQFTLDSAENSLDFESDAEATEYRRSQREAVALAERIAAALSNEIAAGDVSVRVENRRVIIQLQEKATFRSGYADMSAAFR